MLLLSLCGCDDEGPICLLEDHSQVLQAVKKRISAFNFYSPQEVENIKLTIMGQTDDYTNYYIHQTDGSYDNDDCFQVTNISNFSDYLKT